MVFLMSIVISSFCQLAGQSFGYFLDRQYRDNKKLKRITIADKYRWMFRFQWAVGAEVNYFAFWGELFAHFVSLLLILVGVMSFVISSDLYVTICLWALPAYGYIILILSIMLIFQDAVTKPRYRQCLRCQIQSLLHPVPHFYTVLVIDRLHREDGETHYLIVFGKIFPTRFEATAQNNFVPQIGMYAKAIYKSTPPYFHLVSSINSHNTI